MRWRTSSVWTTFTHPARPSYRPLNGEAIGSEYERLIRVQASNRNFGPLGSLDVGEVIGENWRIETFSCELSVEFLDVSVLQTRENTNPDLALGIT